MGFAKYQEDILSRAVHDRHLKKSISQEPQKLVKQNRAVSPAQPELKPQGKKMNRLNEFAMASARPLPVIILADVSGSMGANGKIDALNSAIAEMIAAFAEEDDARAEIHVAVITFGGDTANLHKELTPADKMTWEAMKPFSRTPMGHAFTIAREMIEDKEIIPSRAYRPTLVLVSDGVPTDNWELPLKELLTSERASKSMRLAMAIGEDADKGPLTAFLDDPEKRVYEAHEARKIKNFFRWVTMSVTSRSRSATPNSVVEMEPTNLDDLDF